MFFFFFNYPATTGIYPLSLHDALPICDSWEPEAAAILTALGLDVQGALFPPQERSGEGWEGRGGGRGGRSWRGSGGSSLRYLSEAEWDSEARLTDRTETVQDLECVVIELTFETEGDMPERSFGRGRDRDHSPWVWQDAFVLDSSETLIESTYEVTIEGVLLYSLSEQRPVKLVLEGEIILETNTEMERDEDRKSTRLNSSHVVISYAGFGLKKKKKEKKRKRNLMTIRAIGQIA